MTRTGRSDAGAQRMTRPAVALAALMLCAGMLLAPRTSAAATTVVAARTSAAATTAVAARTGGHGSTATISGRVVKFGLAGFEPDFDPIDRVIISGSLKRIRVDGHALPDAMLVLSLYLENFSSTTVPVLPDLLNPNQTAEGLGGFMQGKAVLINAAGIKVYQGSLLAEVFLDNSVHAVIDITPPADVNAADALSHTIRLLGTFTLDKSLTVSGKLSSGAALSSGALDVPRGQPVSWQSVLAGEQVHLPPMMGRSGNGAPPPTPTSLPPGATAVAAPTQAAQGAVASAVAVPATPGVSGTATALPTATAPVASPVGGATLSGGGGTGGTAPLSAAPSSSPATPGIPTAVLAGGGLVALLAGAALILFALRRRPEPERPHRGL